MVILFTEPSEIYGLQYENIPKTLIALQTEPDPRPAFSSYSNSSEEPSEHNPFDVTTITKLKVVFLDQRAELLTAKTTSVGPKTKTKCLNNVKKELRQHQNYSNLILKTLRKQLPLGAKYLQCDICDSLVINRRDLLLHMRNKHITLVKARRIRQKAFCDICGKQLSDLSNLLVHRRQHTGERPYPCLFENCDKRFKASNERDGHMVVHSNERQFKCDQCTQTFNRKGALRGHRSRVHNNVRPFKCVQCGFSFKTRTCHTNHMRIHTGERPYKCELCNRTFCQRSAYKVHLNIHTDNRPYKCKLCVKAYHSSAARRSHEKIAHNL